MKLKLDQRVSWTTRGKGATTLREGVVVAHVPAGTNPLAADAPKRVQQVVARHTNRGFHDRFTSRRVASVLVLDTREGRLFWPRVEHLEPS